MPSESSGGRCSLFVADASVWVASLVTVDAHYPASRRWFQVQVDRDEPIVAPSIALAEVAGAIARRTGDADEGREAASLMQRLPNIGLVPIDRSLAEFGAGLAADRGLRGADAMYVAVASRLGIPLVTWDDEQLMRGGAVAAVMTPQASLDA